MRKHPPEVDEWSAESWESIRALDLARVIAILPVGAVEAHGPHLPLGTDLIIAEAMARSGAARLLSGGYIPLILPTLSYTAAPFAAAFPGTISLSPATVEAVLLDIARSLGAQGVPLLAIANSHLDPAHIGVIRRVVATLSGPVDGDEGEVPTPIVVFPDITRRVWAARLTDEFRSGACHAGQYETSIVLAEYPELVDDEVRATLPEVPHSLVTAIREGRTSFEDAGGPLAYFGDPAAASAEEGRETIEVLGEILEEAIIEVFTGG